MRSLDLWFNHARDCSCALPFSHCLPTSQNLFGFLKPACHQLIRHVTHP